MDLFNGTEHIVPDVLFKTTTQRLSIQVPQQRVTEDRTFYFDLKTDKQNKNYNSTQKRYCSLFLCKCTLFSASKSVGHVT